MGKIDWNPVGIATVIQQSIMGKIDWNPVGIATVMQQSIMGKIDWNPVGIATINLEYKIQRVVFVTLIKNKWYMVFLFSPVLRMHEWRFLLKPRLHFFKNTNFNLF